MEQQPQELPNPAPTTGNDDEEEIPLQIGTQEKKDKSTLNDLIVDKTSEIEQQMYNINISVIYEYSRNLVTSEKKEKLPDTASIINNLIKYITIVGIKKEKSKGKKGKKGKKSNFDDETIKLFSESPKNFTAVTFGPTFEISKEELSNDIFFDTVKNELSGPDRTVLHTIHFTPLLFDGNLINFRFKFLLDSDKFHTPAIITTHMIEFTVIPMISFAFRLKEWMEKEKFYFQSPYLMMFGIPDARKYKFKQSIVKLFNLSKLKEYTGKSEDVEFIMDVPVAKPLKSNKELFHFILDNVKGEEGADGINLILIYYLMQARSALFYSMLGIDFFDKEHIDFIMNFFFDCCGIISPEFPDLIRKYLLKNSATKTSTQYDFFMKIGGEHFVFTLDATKVTALREKHKKWYEFTLSAQTTDATPNNIAASETPKKRKRKLSGRDNSGKEGKVKRNITEKVNNPTKKRRYTVDGMDEMDGINPVDANTLHIFAVNRRNDSDPQSLDYNENEFDSLNILSIGNFSFEKSDKSFRISSGEYSQIAENSTEYGFIDFKKTKNGSNICLPFVPLRDGDDIGFITFDTWETECNNMFHISSCVIRFIIEPTIALLNKVNRMIVNDIKIPSDTQYAVLFVKYVTRRKECVQMRIFADKQIFTLGSMDDDSEHSALDLQVMIRTIFHQACDSMHASFDSMKQHLNKDSVMGIQMDDEELEQVRQHCFGLMKDAALKVRKQIDQGYDEGAYKNLASERFPLIMYQANMNYLRDKYMMELPEPPESHESPELPGDADNGDGEITVASYIDQKYDELMSRLNFQSYGYQLCTEVKLFVFDDLKNHACREYDDHGDDDLLNNQLELIEAFKKELMQQIEAVEPVLNQVKGWENVWKEYKKQWFERMLDAKKKVFPDKSIRLQDCFKAKGDPNHEHYGKYATIEDNSSYNDKDPDYFDAILLHVEGIIYTDSTILEWVEND